VVACDTWHTGGVTVAPAGAMRRPRSGERVVGGGEGGRVGKAAGRDTKGEEGQQEGEGEEGRGEAGGGRG